MSDKNRGGYFSLEENTGVEMGSYIQVKVNVSPFNSHKHIADGLKNRLFVAALCADIIDDII